MWFDLETTGLDPALDVILEVGCVLTAGFDEGLREIATFSAVVAADESELEQMDTVVRNMHRGTGLWQEVLDSDSSIYEVQEDLLEWMDFHGLTSGVTVGGSGVSRFDVPFVHARMRKVAERFHFRHMDVSSLRAMLKSIGRDDLVAPMSGHAHRALVDARHSADTARLVVDELKI